ncbi:MAG: hypothetical protein ACRD82_10140, partial [Blastocatellia bacterium]
MNTKLQTALSSLMLLCCCAAIVPAQQAQQPAANKPEPPKTGSIKGRVLGDDGQPMANIPVMAIPFGRNAARRQAAPAQPGQPFQAPQQMMPAQIITDDEGNFEFVNLTPASYAISASAPGYVAPLPEDTDGEEENRSGLYRLGDVANISLVKGGVITGKVFNANNETLTGVTVGAVRTGNLNGEADELSAARGLGRSWRTDDRGVYRIYGLIPGTYIVQAGQSGQAGPGQGGRPGGGPGGQLSPYSQDAPTYYPSSARDAAIPFAVHPGSEITGIDIRYRAEKGRSVGGRVIIAQTAAATANQPINRPRQANNFGSTEIRLSVAGTDSVIATTFQSDGFQTSGQTSGQASGFAFYAIPDGEYEITARRNGAAGESDSVSESRRVPVHGADVAGIQLTLTPLALLSGKVVVEKAAAACPSPRRSFTEEILLTAHKEDAATASKPGNRKTTPRLSIAPLASGDFTFRNLEAGRWRLQTQLPDENWYVRSIHSATPTAVAAVRKPTQAATAAALPNIARNGTSLKPGEKLTGVIVTIADGAVSLRGKIVAAKAGGKFPSRLRVHLV